MDSGTCRCAGVRLTLLSFCAVGDMHSFDSDIHLFEYITSFLCERLFFKIHLVTHRSSSTLREILF